MSESSAAFDRLDSEMKPEFNLSIFPRRPKLKTGAAGSLLVRALLIGSLAAGLGACQFQPLYSSSQGTVGNSNIALSGLTVAEVDTRDGQQVRNHLIFLLSGGANPVNPTHEVRLRVTDSSTVLASRVRDAEITTQTGNTAGSVKITASYEIYDFQKKKIIFRGTRNSSAAYDKTNQNFASSRAQRDAQNRAAREVAEQLRFAISSDFNRI